MDEVSYRLHALEQMIERGISRTDVQHAIDGGDIVEEVDRPGRPFPTRLLLGWRADRPLHVLVADDPDGPHYVITVYEPSTEQWKTDFRTRKERP